MMSTIPDFSSTEQLLTETDELVRQINSNFIKDMKEEHSLLMEAHVRKLKKLKAAVQAKIIKKKSSGAEGMHEAILDIVKAMRDLTKYIS